MSNEDYLIGIGKRIRHLRKEHNLNLSELAGRASVSTALISRIENGRTLPSLPVLFSIIGALEEDPGTFFDGLVKENGSRYVVIRADEMYEVEKEQAEGFVYNFVFSKRLPSEGFEAVVLSLYPGSKRDEVTTEAFEFKYMLEGECEYVLGNETVVLREGDALFFDGRVPHVPRNRGDRVARMLVIYMYTGSASTGS